MAINNPRENPRMIPPPVSLDDDPPAVDREDDNDNDTLPGAVVILEDEDLGPPVPVGNPTDLVEQLSRDRETEPVLRAYSSPDSLLGLSLPVPNAPAVTPVAATPSVFEVRHDSSDGAPAKVSAVDATQEFRIAALESQVDRILLKLESQEGAAPDAQYTALHEQITALQTEIAGMRQGDGGQRRTVTETGVMRVATGVAQAAYVEQIEWDRKLTELKEYLTLRTRWGGATKGLVLAAVLGIGAVVYGIYGHMQSGFRASERSIAAIRDDIGKPQNEGRTLMKIIEDNRDNVIEDVGIKPEGFEGTLYGVATETQGQTGELEREITAIKKKVEELAGNAPSGVNIGNLFQRIAQAERLHDGLVTRYEMGIERIHTRITDGYRKLLGITSDDELQVEMAGGLQGILRNRYESLTDVDGILYRRLEKIRKFVHDKFDVDIFNYGEASGGLIIVAPESEATKERRDEPKRKSEATPMVTATPAGQYKPLTIEHALDATIPLNQFDPDMQQYFRDLDPRDLPVESRFNFRTVREGLLRARVGTLTSAETADLIGNYNATGLNDTRVLGALAYLARQTD